MVPCDHLHFDNVFAFVKHLSRAKPGTVLERRLAVIRWKPNRVALVPYNQGLPKVKETETEGSIDRFQFPIAFSYYMDVRNPFEPFADPRPACGNFEVRYCRRRGQVESPGEIGHRSHAVERRLHRTGRYLKRLEKEGADAHRHGQSDKQHLHILPQAAIAIRL